MTKAAIANEVHADIAFVLTTTTEILAKLETAKPFIPDNPVLDQVHGALVSNCRLLHAQLVSLRRLSEEAQHEHAELIAA